MDERYVFPSRAYLANPKGFIRDLHEEVMLKLRWLEQAATHYERAHYRVGDVQIEVFRDAIRKVVMTGMPQLPSQMYAELRIADTLEEYPPATNE